MPEVFIDPRDGQTYKTVKIKNQIWLAENLRYKGPVKKINTWVIEEKDFYYPPDGKQKNIPKYGCLYTWKNAIKACPPGWKLPTKTDFDNLLAYVTKHRKSSHNFPALIAKRSEEWIEYNDEVGDDFGFNTIPAGRCHEGYYYDFGYIANFWSATECEDDSNGAYQLFLGNGYASVNGYYKKVAFSIRCVKD